MLAALILLGISLLAVIVTLVRRFPQASVLDVETIAAERQKMVKEQLAMARLKRSAEAVGEKLKGTFAPVQKVVSSGAKSVYDRVMNLEKKYQEERRAIARPLKDEEKSTVANLLTQGQDLIEDGRYGEAEQVFIQVVALDARSIPAYKGLARIYLETKQLDQAKETVDFLLKLKPGDAESFAMRSEIAYSRGDLRVAEEEMVKAAAAKPDEIGYVVDLAQILYEAKKYAEAAANMKKAVAQDENNPKYLDFLVDASIQCSDVKGARTALERLKAVNPENKKIQEFEERLK